LFNNQRSPLPGPPRVALIATGGTIASAPGPDGRLVPRLTAADLIGRLPEPPGVAVEGHDAERRAGWNMDPPAMLEVARRADQLLAAGATGIVVTHGTDTIEETAALLHVAVQGRGPVVVTGALRHDGASSPDGPANLLDAVRVAADPASAGRGCLVVLHGEVHAAPWVTKAHSHALDAFASPGRGPVGVVEQGGRVRFLQPAAGRRPLAVADASADVALVRVAAGASDTPLRAAVAAGADGVVVEGSGLGHLPGAWMPALRQVLAAGIPVVRTSRAAAGGTGVVYDGPGGDRELRAAGVIDGGGRSGLAARIELICAIGAGLAGDQLRARFESDSGSAAEAPAGR
jgi:L-asparaginase